MKPGEKVLAYDWATHEATLDFTRIDANYKPALVLVIRPNNLLADIVFIETGRIAKAMLVPMLRQWNQ